MADRNVSDQASSASAGPRTARQTRSTVPPCAATIASNGCLPVIPGRRRWAGFREMAPGSAVLADELAAAGGRAQVLSEALEGGQRGDEGGLLLGGHARQALGDD